MEVIMGRLYSRRKLERYAYPNELEIIMGYLKKRGDVKGARKEIEQAYFKFSNEHFEPWLPISDSTLAEFEEWLDDED